MKLIQTGQWYWRQDELSFKQFTLLSKKEKEEYIFLLNGLPEDERSTNDLYILNLFTKQEEPKSSKFLEL
jgi:hypothetical protein